MTVLNKVQPLVRTSFLPCVEAGVKDLLGSRYGGFPAMFPDESIPKCDCGEAMSFILQLNLVEAPQTDAGLPSTGLIQVFHCSSPDCSVEGDWEGFTSTKFCRNIPQEKFDKLQQKLEAEPYPPQSIIGWQTVEADYPHNEEECIDELELDDEEVDQYINISCEAEASCRDKLLGWPSFVQGIEYEHCPKCHERMLFAYQINSEEHVPVMWGDCGTAILFICAKHHEVITYNWACG